MRNISRWREDEMQNGKLFRARSLHAAHVLAGMTKSVELFCIYFWRTTGIPEEPFKSGLSRELL